MKLPCLLLLSPGLLLAQIPDQSTAPIDRKIDLTTPSLPENSGVAFWYEGQGYHGASIVSASLDGSMVTLSTSAGRLQAEWKKLPPDAKAKFYSDYQAAVAQANAEAENALREEQIKSEVAAGIQTYRNARVVTVSLEGILLSPASTAAHVFLKGYPDVQNLAEGDTISFKATEDGLYQYTKASGDQSTVHALKFARLVTD